MTLLAILAFVAAPTQAPAAASEAASVGPNLERFDYAYPVRWFDTRSQGAPVRMAYLDLAPSGPANGRVVVLLHGKNFCAGTWGETAAALAARGYRVIAPDQIGFCKSSKPAGFQYSVAALASLTRDLLAGLGVTRPILVGHSTGGLIAMRFALLFPDRLSGLVLVNPLGLSDPLAQGVPYADLDVLRAEEAKTDAGTIRAYQLKNYYHGQWRSDYDRWVTMLAGQYASPGGDAVRDAQARLSEMIETQPIAADLPRLRLPVTLIIGQADVTAFRADTAPAPLRPRVQTVPQAAEEAAHRIPGARLVRLDGLGHAPQIEAPRRFEQILIEALES